MNACVTRRLRPLFGTYVEVGAAGTADEAIEAAYRAMQTLHRELSFQDAGSSLSRLNRSSGEWIGLSHHAIRVLRFARALMKASGGLFDCTVGAQLVRRGVLPSHDRSRRADAGHESDIDIRGGTVRLRKPLQITLDGIAKGYAVDIGIGTLRRCGVRAGWINAGGDMRAFGSVILPVSRREADGSLRELGGLRDAAIATSAVVAQCDARFPGTIVASNNRRVPCGVWTVVAARAWRADALTKVAALAAPEDRMAILQRLGGRLVEPEDGYRQ